MTECLKELHWLAIQQRIDFKILILVFKFLNKETPEYLWELIVKEEQRREGLISGTKDNILEVPTPKEKHLQIGLLAHMDQPCGINYLITYIHVSAWTPSKNH